MTQDERDVEALTQEAAAGDRDALEELLTRMLPDLRAFVRLRAGRLVQRHDEHSDIVQSVCREIARELGIGAGAVRMRLHRALARLAVVLERLDRD